VEVAVDGRRQIIPRRPLDQVQLERSRGQAVEAGKDLRSNGQLDPLDSDDDLGWYAPADGANLVPQRLEDVFGVVAVAADRRVVRNGGGSQEVEADDQRSTGGSNRIGQDQAGAHESESRTRQVLATGQIAPDAMQQHASLQHVMHTPISAGPNLLV